MKAHITQKELAQRMGVTQAYRIDRRKPSSNPTK
jgi:predicted transcriptional regulator